MTSFQSLDRNPKIKNESIADNKGENNMETAIQIEKEDQNFPEPVIDEIASIETDYRAKRESYFQKVRKLVKGGL